MERIEAAVLYDYLNRRIPLTMSEFMIGRSQNAHFVINDQKVSRQHARISYKNGIYVVSDLNSRNGTFVNGKNISDHETILHGNDRISIIGKYFFLYQESDDTLTGTSPQFSPGILLDTRSGNVWIENTLISPPLSPNCFRLLELLCQDPGRLYTYEDIHRFIWPNCEYFGEADRNRCHVVKKQTMEVLRKYNPNVNCIQVISKRGMRLTDPRIEK